jgi:chromosome segregation ATPase
VIQRVVEDAQASPAMPPHELQAARQRLGEARSAIETALAEQPANNTNLQDIETRLFGKDDSSSTLASARTKVDAARETVDRDFRRVLSLPPRNAKATETDYIRETQSLTAEQQEALSKDEPFQQAVLTLVAATKDYSRQQKALCENDPGWKAEAEQAKQRVHADIDARARSFTGAMGATPTGALAAEGRATIAVAKLGLRSMETGRPVVGTSVKATPLRDQGGRP